MVYLLSRERALSIEEPALNWRWMVYMPDLPNFSDAARRVIGEQMQFSHRKIPSQARFGGGTYTYYPTISDIDSVSITFYEDRKYTVTKYLYSWRKLIFNPQNGVYGVPGTYKRTIYFEMYDLEDNMAFAGTLKGCYPTEQDSYSVDYNESGRLVAQANFSVDDSELLTPGVGGTGILQGTTGPNTGVT